MDIELTHVSKLRYTRDSFEHVFSADLNAYLLQQNVLAKPKIEIKMLCTIRGIYDSMYADFLLNNTEVERLHPRFIDFVYSWLSSFEFDMAARKVVHAADAVNANVRRGEFFAMLKNPSTSKVWECVVFSQFLHENHSIEELYFYLHWRFMLFRQNQLEAPGGSFELIHFLNFDKIVHLLPLALPNLPD